MSGDARLKALVPLLSSAMGKGPRDPNGAHWPLVATHLFGRSAQECRDRYEEVMSGRVAVRAAAKAAVEKAVKAKAIEDVAVEVTRAAVVKAFTVVEEEEEVTAELSETESWSVAEPWSANTMTTTVMSSAFAAPATALQTTDEYGMRVHEITLPSKVAPYQRVEFKTDDDQVVNCTAPYNAKPGMKMKVHVPDRFRDLSQLQDLQIPLGLLAVGEEVEEEELYASRVELLLFR